MKDEARRFSVLVVDDTPENVELLDEILNKKYRVLVALNGQRALEIAAGQPQPDLILLDIMMPEMDGHEVCRRLKADVRTRDIPVVFVTARSEANDERVGFMLGAIDYITKPISPPIVEARIAAHLALSHRKKELEILVAQRTFELSEANQELVQANERLQQEVRAREKAMARAEYVSQFDPMTGLPNRRQLLEKLRHELMRAKEQGGFVPVVHVNLDRLQTVNNALGSGVGDELLVHTGRRLLKSLRQEELVARDGGDNFIIVPTRHYSTAQEAEREVLELINNLLGKISEPYAIEDRTVRLTASAGVALYPRDCETGVNLLTRAQIATTRSKKQGGNRVEVYESSLGSGYDTRFSTEARLRDALNSRQLVIFLQPQCDLSTMTVVGAETLVRWPDGQGGYISNGLFIPLAEEAGLIRELDHYVLRELCHFIRTRADHLPPEFRFAFNFSPIGFQDLDAVDEVKKIIDDSGINPNRLELEVTEYAVVADVATAVDKLNELRDFGLHIALDDFGTGYSSLAYLKSLPLDKVKIDGAFVHDIERDATSAAIARTIIMLANTLELGLVAEGIETQSQLDFVLDCGCRVGQGYFMHRPAIADKLLEHFPTPAQA